MDFFNRQDRIKTQSRLFFTTFFIALALAVIAIYFAVTFGILLVGSLTHTSGVSEDGFGSFTPYYFSWPPFSGEASSVIEGSLPADLYGHPPRVISARPFLRVGGVIVLIILFSVLCKCLAIRSGGGAYIAKKLGGVQIKDPQTPAEKRLINIVEEMALASGLPVPGIYVLPRENTINAITAGLNHNDAVIAVTKGALDQLTRDELQGVLAHEFAHILNEDCVLNMIMAGWLYGLLVFSATGKGMCSAATVAMEGAAKVELDLRVIIGAVVFVYIPGAVLRAAGSLGHLTASIIEAAFSRSREHLADAFAVQFTRNPKGLAGALKKIGGTPRRANVRSGQALAMKSFFIASPNPRRNGGLLSSHPSLKSRIIALDPQWDRQFTSIVLGRSKFDEMDFPAGSESLSGSPGASPRPSERWLTAALAALTAEAQDAGGPSESYSRLAGYGLRKAAEFQASLPYNLQWMLKTPGGVEALVYALFLDERPEVRDRQMELIDRIAGRAAMITTADIYPQLTANMRLPLLELSNPALRNLSEESRRRLGQGVDALVTADGRVDIYEIAGMIILKKSVLPPASMRKAATAGPEVFARDAATILTCLAHMGTPDHGEAEAAFRTACAHCPDLAGPPPLAARDAVSSRALMEALERLGQAPRKNRVELLRAAMAGALHDGAVVTHEYHLLSALAASLGLPLPWPSIMED